MAGTTDMNEAFPEYDFKTYPTTVDPAGDFAQSCHYLDIWRLLTDNDMEKMTDPKLRKDLRVALESQRDAANMTGCIKSAAYVRQIGSMTMGAPRCMLEAQEAAVLRDLSSALTAYRKSVEQLDTTDSYDLFPEQTSFGRFSTQSDSIILLGKVVAYRRVLAKPEEKSDETWDNWKGKFLTKAFARDSRTASDDTVQGGRVTGGAE